jgi:hypothetical protein
MGRLVATAISALLLATPAVAAPAPQVGVEVDGSGYARTVVVRVAGKAGRPVTKATVLVSASMSAPGHFMSVAPRRAGGGGRGIYRARLQFPMLGQWILLVRVEAAGLRAMAKRVVIGL